MSAAMPTPAPEEPLKMAPELSGPEVDIGADTPLKTLPHPSEPPEVHAPSVEDGSGSSSTIQEEEEDIPRPPDFVVALFESEVDPDNPDNLHFPRRPPVRPWTPNGQVWISFRVLAWIFCLLHRIVYSLPLFNYVSSSDAWGDFESLPELVIRDRVETFLVDCNLMLSLKKPNEPNKWIDGIIAEIKRLTFPIRVEPNPFQVWASYRFSLVKGDAPFSYLTRGEVTTGEAVRAFIQDNPHQAFGDFEFEAPDSDPVNRATINRISQKLNCAVLAVFNTGSNRVKHVDSAIPRLVNGKVRYRSGFQGLLLRPPLGASWQKKLSPNQNSSLEAKSSKP